MMETVICSVIVPIYQAKLYLRECLDSICRQTLENIEIICIDDASTDGSGHIAQEYAVKDSRIRYVSLENNRGLGAARNTGLDLAKGRYVLFVDSDDFLSVDALQILYKTAERERTEVVYFNAEQFHDNDPGHTSLFFPAIEQNKTVTGRQILAGALNNHYFRGSACTQYWRRESLTGKGLRFKEGIYHEDALFSLQSQIVVERAVVISDILYHYRVRENSIMTDPAKIVARKKSLLHIYGETIDIMRTVCAQDLSLLQPMCNYLDTLSIMLDLTYTTAEQHRELNNALDPNSREYCIYRLLKGANGRFINWDLFDRSILKESSFLYIYGCGRVAAEVLDHLGDCCSFYGVVSSNGNSRFWHGLRIIGVDSLQADACLIYAPDSEEPQERSYLKSLKGVRVYFPPRR